MVKLLQFPSIKFVFCFIIGICIAHFYQFDFYNTAVIVCCIISLVFISWLILKNKISQTSFFAILTYICLIGFGAIGYQIQNEKLASDHYTSFINKNHDNDLILKIEERLKPDTYNHKYMVSVCEINQHKAVGKLLINIKKDSVFKSLPVDAVLFTSAKFNDIQKPLNPHQFDYSAYLELKQVYHQLYLPSFETLHYLDTAPTVYGYADQLRTLINQRLIASGFKDDVLSIINALLLGQRQSIDKTIYNNFVNSGTIHILAVSGLHVGILLIILNFVFKPLLYLKYGRILRPAIIVILLWSFAIIAGLSPSVTRAVTMFSLISIAMHLKRPANIYNTLAISAFLILLFKPNFLFEVGFQMSYLAVIGIVSVQPLIYKLWQPKFLVIDKLWQVFTVTLAAQLGVAPISLFYFHQFPGLFFVSNLVIIPFLGLILGLGIAVIILALTQTLTYWIVDIYSTIINGLNHFISWIAQFEDFLFRDIPFTLIQVVLGYFVIIAFVQFYKLKSYQWLMIALIGIIGFQLQYIYMNFQNTSESLVVFNKSRYSMLGIRRGEHLEVHHNLSLVKAQTDNVIKNYKVGERLKMVSRDSLQPVYQFKDKRLLVIDSLGVYNNLSFKTDLVLLRNSPKINLNRAIDSLTPELIIVDASNYKSYVRRWKATSREKEIPFHYTNEEGAFILQ